MEQINKKKQKWISYSMVLLLVWNLLFGSCPMVYAENMEGYDVSFAVVGAGTPVEDGFVYNQTNIEIKGTFTGLFNTGVTYYYSLGCCEYPAGENGTMTYLTGGEPDYRETFVPDTDTITVDYSTYGLDTSKNYKFMLHCWTEETIDEQTVKHVDTKISFMLGTKVPDTEARFLVGGNEVDVSSGDYRTNQAVSVSLEMDKDPRYKGNYKITKKIGNDGAEEPVSQGLIDAWTVENNNPYHLLFSPGTLEGENDKEVTYKVIYYLTHTDGTEVAEAEQVPTEASPIEHTFVVDRRAPVISQSVKVDNGSSVTVDEAYNEVPFVNNSISYTLGSDEAGTATISVKRDNPMTGVSQEEIVPLGETDIPLDGINAHPKEIDVSTLEDGEYTIYARVWDAVGNEVTNGDQPKTRFKVDKTAPEIEIVRNGASVEENGIHYCNQTQTLRFSVKDFSPNPAGYKIYVSKDGGNTYTPTAPDAVSGGVNGWEQDTGNPYLHKATLTISEDGDYRIRLYGKDAKGNETAPQTMAEKELAFIYDGTTPVIDVRNVQVTSVSSQGQVHTYAERVQGILANVSYVSDRSRLGFDVIENNYETVKITVTTDYTHGGTTTQSVQTKEDAETYSYLSNPKGIRASYRFNEEGFYKAVIGAKDMAGNESLDVTKYFVVDLTNPTFRISGVEEGKAYRGGQQITFTSVEENPNLDTYVIMVEKWLKNGTHEGPAAMAISSDSWSASGDTYSQILSFSEEGNYRVTFTGKDKAGRTGNTAAVTFRIDKTSPVVSFVTVEDGSYHNESVNVQILLDEFNLSDTQARCFVKRTLDGSIAENREITLNTRESSEFSFMFREEGLYDIWINARDAAGNEAVTEEGLPVSEKHIRFVIDLSSPVFQLVGMEDGEMTRNPVTIEARATDRNHDFSSYRIQVTRKDSSGVRERFDIEGNQLCSYDVGDGWKKDGYVMEKQCVYTSIRTLRFEEEGFYDLIISGNDLAVNQGEKQRITFYIDNTPPEISQIQYSDDNNWLLQRYNTVFSNHSICVEFDVRDSVVGVEDQDVYVTVGDVESRNNETPIYLAHKVRASHYCVYIPSDVDVEEFSDVITIWAKDRLGNEGHATSDKLIYHTGPSDIAMYSDVDYNVWRNQDVTFHTTVRDEKSGIREIIYTVNDKEVRRIVFQELTTEYSADITASETASSDSGYGVTVTVVNNAGTRHSMSRQVFIDKVKPKVALSGIEGGKHYRTNQTFKTLVEDVSYQNTKTQYFITRTLDGKTQEIPMAIFRSNQYEDVCMRKLLQEGSYKVYAVTTDSAGNQSVSNTLSFVIDKTAPKLNISGVSRDAMSGSPVTLDFTCTESFFKTNQISIQVERTLDGVTTRERISGFPRNAKKTSLQHTFSQDGTYQITFTAKDKAGNVASTKTITFSVDQTKPEISIMGSSNYQQWDRAATIQFVVEESYYSGNKVSIQGTKTDIDGKVTELEISSFVSSGKRSVLAQTFGEDGVYALSIRCEDEAGNRDEKSIHFTVDQSAPQIRGVEACSGKYYQEFCLANSLEDVFKDLTVVSYHILLNGVEYSGTERVTQDGKYELYVEAEDELGHVSRRNVEFVIDHTAPKILFSGVKEGQTVYDQGEIEFVLANTEDEITSVRMNGVEYGGDTRVLSYSEYGPYRIEVDCVDKAGNAVTRTLYFVYSSPLINVIFCAGLIGVVLVTGLWIWKRRKERIQS